ILSLSRAILLAKSTRWLRSAATCFSCSAGLAPAYVDMAPTLARIVRESETIAVVEVDRFSAERGIVLLKAVRDLKGKGPTESIKHRVVSGSGAAVEHAILEWAEPGRRGVLFVTA